MKQRSQSRNSAKQTKSVAPFRPSSFRELALKGIAGVCLVWTYFWIVLLIVSLSYTVSQLEVNNQIALVNKEYCFDASVVDLPDTYDTVYINVGKRDYFDTITNTYLKQTDFSFAMEWLLDCKLILGIALTVLGFATSLIFKQSKYVIFFWVVGIVTLAITFFIIFSCIG